MPEDDQDKMLAFERHLRVRDADRHADCGTRPSEWVDEKGRRLNEPAWVVEVVDCPGCDAIDAAYSEIDKEERHRKRVRLRRAKATDRLDLD